MGEDPREEKGEDRGGKGGKDLNQGKTSWGGQGRAKDLREEKGEALRGGKGLRGERVGRISTGKGGKQS